MRVNKNSAPNTAEPLDARFAGAQPSRPKERRMLDDAGWMLLALGEADLAPQHGDVPVGSVIVSADGVELGRGHNQREELGDPTAHAEIEALRAAARKIGHWRLNGATVYSTLEPCPMCAGALVNARVARLVYAAADPKAGAIESKFGLGMDERLNHRFAVTSGVLAVQAAAQLRAFFEQLRAEGQK
jgi:tRNA(adenine34) deaminase